MGDSDKTYKERICSGISGKRTTRVYEWVNTNAAFLIKVKTSLTYKLRRFSRDQSRRPRNIKLKHHKGKPNLVTPLKNIRSLTTIVRANWNNALRRQPGRKPTYVFSDYTAPKPSAGYLGGLETKEYLGSFDVQKESEQNNKKPKKEETENIEIATPQDISYKMSKPTDESYQKAA